MPSAKLVVDLVANQVSAVDVNAEVDNFVAMLFVIVVLKAGSLLMAVATSVNVFKLDGAPCVKVAIANPRSNSVA